MHATPTTRRRALAAGLLVIAGVGGAAGLAIGSDHQDTPEVELNPRQDMTDVYAFPGSAPGRIVLVMNSRAFLTPGATAADASFDPDLLYQFKVDNDGDAREDRVIQVTFTGSGAEQQVQVRGPIAPPVQGAMMNEVADVSPVLSGVTNAPLGGFLRPPGFRRPARRSVLPRSRGRLLHPPRPEAGRRTAGGALRSHAESQRAVLLPQSRHQLRPGLQRAVHRGRAAELDDRERRAGQAGHLGNDQPLTRLHRRRHHMHRTNLSAARRWALTLTITATAFAAAACSDDNGDGGNGPAEPRAYNQIQRLGNPLVSEVLLSKRSHPTHGSIGPEDDVALIGAEALGFLTGPGSVAGRSAEYANTLGGALLPDMLIVQTDKGPATAGWLTWLPLAPFANGYGGRKLDDDVVDLALLAVFGDPFGADPDGAAGKEALTTDNVGTDSPVLSAFPYVGAPN